MTSLGDTYGAQRERRRIAQLTAGASLLLAGGVAFGLGFARFTGDALASAGVGVPLATAAGFALAGTALPAAFVALRTQLAGERGKQWLAPGGGLVGVSIVALLATAGATGALPSGAAAWPIGTMYAAGVALLVGSALAAALESEEPSARPGVDYKRPTARHSGPVPADGGEDDDDLEFPLDDE